MAGVRGRQDLRLLGRSAGVPALAGAGAGDSVPGLTVEVPGPAPLVPAGCESRAGSR